MTASPLDISCIFDAIVGDISLDDICNCTLVCQNWHQIFTPALWRDVISYRPEQIEDNSIETDCYFTDTESLRYLVRKCRHIRTLTILGVDLLKALMESRQCTNLTEFNLVINQSDPNTTMDFELLTCLCLQNNQLKTLSVENLDCRDNIEPIGAMRMLIELSDHPNMRSLYIGPTNIADDFPLKYVVVVLVAMLRRYQDKFLEITSLTFTSNFVTRAVRGSPMLRSWGKWRTEGSGSYENEDAIAFLEREPGKITVRYSPFMSNDGSTVLLDFLKRCPGLLELKLDNYACNLEDIVTGFPALCPSLTSVILGSHELNLEETTGLLSELSDIRSISTLCMSGLGDSTALLAKHFSTLEDITFSCSTVSMEHVLTILGNCPKLTKFIVPQCVIPSRGSLECPPWVCQDLHTFGIGIYIEGQDYMTFTLLRGATIEFIPEAQRLAEKLAAPFREQLNKLGKLRTLELWLSENSPFLTLDLDPEHGLPSLSDLRSLQTIVVEGFSMTFASREVTEWVGKHWPYTTLITSPSLFV